MAHVANDAAHPVADTTAAPGSLAALLALVGDTLFDALFDHVGPVYVASATGKLLYANHAYQEFARRQGAVGLLPGHRQAIAAVVERREPAEAPEAIPTSDEPRACTVRHVPIFAGEWLVAVCGSIVDSSGETAALARERREKQRFHDVIRSTSDWVWETSETGGLSFVSDRIVDVLGIPPRLLRGRKLTELGRFVEDGEEPPVVAALMQQRRPFRDARFAIGDPQAGGRLFHLSGVPVFEESGRFLGYRGTATDVTARHAAEEAARQSRRQLEDALAELTSKNLQLDVALRKATAATRAKSEFLATMSHELRTPLNAIIGFSELMQMGTFGPLPNPYQGYIGDVLKAARHLLELIDDILDIARIEGKAVRLDIRNVPVAELVSEARLMIESRALERNVDIAAVSYQGPLVVAADHTRAMQILLNLLGNAVKFTPSGGRIGLEVSRTAKTVQIVVWDTGIGVPADKQDLIFEKFQQAHEGVLARRQQGIGLGLTLSRQLARLMHGDLRLDHSDGGGSRFSIVLPLA